ncbi:EpsG family protein [Limosilactobacillus reuteri subsp. suis]|uniref:EpsG family protein n=1 Tax=Limosilactobacillus reuteri TaxID=1598 RepID=UPI003995C36F
MAILFFILLILLGLVFNIKYWYVPIIAFLVYLTYNSTLIPDYENYNAMYNFIANGNQDINGGWGWYWVCYYAAQYGLTYSGLRAIIMLVGCSIILITFHYFKISNKYSFTWSLFLLYPALLEIVQIRFFLAEAIVFLSFIFVSKDDVKSKIVSIIIIIIASQVHSSMYLFLLFIIFMCCYNVIIERTNTIIFIILVASFAMRGLMAKIITIFVNDQRQDRYITNGQSLGPFGIVSTIATVMVFYLLMREIIMRTSIKEVGVRHFALIKLVYILSVFSFILIPLSTFDPNYFRLQRLIWLPMFNVIAILINSNKPLYLMNQSFSPKLVITCLTLIGNIAFICTFNFNILVGIFEQ